MSASPNSSDIEDVVSSVRRLVSVDGRTRPVTRDLWADRLVLTPALRIVSDSVPEVEVAEKPVLPVVEAADQPTAAVPDPEPVLAAEAAAPAFQVVEDDWEDEIWAEADPSLAELALGAEEAELVPAAVAEDAGDPLRPAIDRDAPWAQVEGTWADDLPDPVVPFAAQRARMASLAAAPPRNEPVELTDPDGNPLTILDEDALQDMVRQLIREELQGGLGERITRNVRKLVRAEINRALTARALD